MIDCPSFPVCSVSLPTSPPTYPASGEAGVAHPLRGNMKKWYPSPTMQRAARVTRIPVWGAPVGRMEWIPANLVGRGSFGPFAFQRDGESRRGYSSKFTLALELK